MFAPDKVSSGGRGLLTISDVLLHDATHYVFGVSVTIDYNLPSRPDHPTLADGLFEAVAMSSN